MGRVELNRDSFGRRREIRVILPKEQILSAEIGALFIVSLVLFSHDYGGSRVRLRAEG